MSLKIISDYKPAKARNFVACFLCKPFKLGYNFIIFAISYHFVFAQFDLLFLWQFGLHTKDTTL